MAGLDRFAPVVREWFQSAFPAPTPAQEQGWSTIADGHHSLILAPTGSGKTLAAFLWGIDEIMTAEVPDRAERTRILYLSPLRALAVDVEKNLRAPLLGIELAAERTGVDVHRPEVGLRTGDTPPAERQRLLRRPPDLLITTPESLYLMLTSRARETLRNVRAVIIDEIHAVAATKRGTHLAVSLERLEEITHRPPQRIGLSATQRPLDEIARFLGGHGPDGTPRPVSVVDVGSTKPLELEVIVPVEDMGDLSAGTEPAPDGAPAAGSSIWPSVHPRLLELVLQHRSTLIFTNARRLAERLATRLNELHLRGDSRAGEFDGTSPPPGMELVKAHHGSLSREQRLVIEDELKQGRLRGLVATSSLELGIDMGAVDLVVQVESPGSVAGRPAARRPRRPPGGRAEPGQDLPQAPRATCSRPRSSPSACGPASSRRPATPATPSTCSCQQIVAMCAVDDWVADDLLAVIRRAAPYAELSDEVYEAVLDLLSGRYPSDEFSELRPRIVWDRLSGALRRPRRARAGSPSPTRAPSPTAASSACSYPTASGSASSTRRWSTRAGSARRSCSAPRPGGSRPSTSTASWSRRHPDSRARCRSGTATDPAAPSSSAGRSAPFTREIVEQLQDSDGPPGAVPPEAGAPRAAAAATSTLSTNGPPPTCSCFLDRAAGRHRRGARRPHRGRRAVPGRDRRLAGLRAVAVRGPRARAVGDGAEGDAGGAVRGAGRDPLERRRHRAAGSPRPRTPCRSTPCSSTPTTSTTSSSATSRARRCSPPGSARPPDGRCSCPGAAPTSARRSGSNASGPPTCCRSRRATRASRSCSRRRGSACRRCSTSPPSPRSWVSSAAAASGSCPSTPTGPARWPSRSCSAGSPSTCTRATRRSPSDGPPPSRSTATCSGTSSAPRSCGS